MDEHSSFEEDVVAKGSRTLSYQPMVLFALAFVVGILTERFLGLPWQASLAMATILVAAWAFVFVWPSKVASSSEFASPRAARRQAVAALLLFISIASVGAFWFHARWNWFGANEIGLFAKPQAQSVCVRGKIVSEPRFMADVEDSLAAIPRKSRTKMAFRVTGIKDKLTWLPASGMTDLIVHSRIEELRSGDEIELLGRLVSIKGPSNPGQFDFQKFSRAKSRLATVHVYYEEAISTLGRTGPFDPSRVQSSLRRRLNNLVWKHVDEARAPLASAILLGNREQLTDSRRELFLVTGTVHLLAISGLHVGILAGLLFVFYRLGFVSRRKFLWMTIAFVLFYAWLVEFRPPVSRAAILIVLLCIGRLLGHSSFSFNWLALAGVIVLLINPYDLFQVGTQLSFLAVTTITFGMQWMFLPPSNDPLKRLVAKTRPFHVRTINWWGRKLRAAFLVSGIIWIVALPLVAYNFHLVAPIALLVNPILLVPISFALYGGMGVFVLGGFIAPLADVCGWLCDSNLALIEWMIGCAHVVPGSHSWMAGPSLASVLIFYFGVWLFAIYPPTKLKGKWLLLLACCWLVFGWLVPEQIGKMIERGQANKLECTFIDVGHGTSVLIETPSGKKLLYDAGCFGSSAYGFETVSSVLWSKKIEHLDAIVLSHADVDHFNAIPEICEKFSIGVSYLSPVMIQDDSSAVNELLDSFEQFQVPVRSIAHGDRLVLDDSSQVVALGPPVEGTAASDNSNSVVLLVEYAGKKILLSGDLESKGMELLLALDSIDTDVVMAPHHGSKNSSPEEFKAWSNPEFVVVSASTRNINPDVLRVFASHGSTVLRTDRDGAVRFQISDQGMQAARWSRNAWSHVEEPVMESNRTVDVRESGSTIR